MCQFVAFQPENVPLSRRTVDATSSCFAANAFGCVEHEQNGKRVPDQSDCFESNSGVVSTDAGDVTPSPPRVETRSRSACPNGRRS